MKVEQYLRATLREMAGQARGVDELARTAMLRGVRMRRRRRLAAVSGAVALLLAALTPFVLKRTPSPEIAIGPTASASPSRAASSGQLSEVEPRGLAGGWVLAGVHNWVLDRGSNTYTRLRAQQKDESRYLASPAGGLAAIVSRDAEGSQDLIDFVTTAGVPVRTVRIASNGVYQWSPQGDRLLTGVWGAKDPGVSASGFGFAVIEARTGHISDHRVETQRYDCSMCAFAWSRDGGEVALGIADRRGREAAERYAGVQFFDARNGRPTRAMPLRAMFAGPFSWSPSGRYVIVRPDALSSGYQIVDTQDFSARPFPYDAVFVTDGVLLVAEADQILAIRAEDGAVVDRFELSGGFKGLGATAEFGPPG